MMKMTSTLLRAIKLCQYCNQRDYIEKEQISFDIHVSNMPAPINMELIIWNDGIIGINTNKVLLLTPCS